MTASFAPLAIPRLVSDFRVHFGLSPRVFSAPGRVNLIGEHTDYNDGFVLPMAIERRTYVLGAERAGGTVSVHSANLKADFEFDLGQPSGGKRGVWGDYIEGTAVALARRGPPLRGAALWVESEVPAGAGLSASAALEMSAGFALATLSGRVDLDLRQLALDGQNAEHDYVGMLCGIMDQYISALGRTDHALLIDCRTLEPELVPLSLGTARVVVCDTRVKHQLASSEYNVRRAECERGVALLAQALPGIRALRDVTLEQLRQQAQRLPELVFKRCHHVVTENDRTLRAAAALARGELAEVGELMLASHRSLRDDYAVSCAELDRAVELAMGVPGVYGARMTGGGFGGCAVVLVETRSIPELTQNLLAGFADSFGTVPEVFATNAANGVVEHRIADLPSAHRGLT